MNKFFANASISPFIGQIPVMSCCDASDIRVEAWGDDSFHSYADDDHLSEVEARRYASIIVEAGDKADNARPYEYDADEIFVHNVTSQSEGVGGEVSFSITLASLYTVFNSDFLIANNITCIVNMAGCSALCGAAMYYMCDLDRDSEDMEGVKKRCGYNIKKLVDDGEE